MFSNTLTATQPELSVSSSESTTDGRITLRSNNAAPEFSPDGVPSTIAEEDMIDENQLENVMEMLAADPPDENDEDEHDDGSHLEDDEEEEKYDSRLSEEKSSLNENHSPLTTSGLLSAAMATGRQRSDGKVTPLNINIESADDVSQIVRRSPDSTNVSGEVVRRSITSPHSGGVNSRIAAMQSLIEKKSDAQEPSDISRSAMDKDKGIPRRRSMKKQRTLSIGSNGSTGSNKSSSSSKSKKNRSDFDFGGLIGEGSYGKVYHARLKANNKEYAIKVIERKQVMRREKKKYIIREKQALMIVNHPNLMKLYFAFQDDYSLYFVLEYCEGGELMKQVKQTGGCTLKQAQFYAAEIVLALEYLRSKCIIHRDLKPENVLLQANGHVVLTDFGTARLLSEDSGADKITGVVSGRKNSFVGSAEYVSPEILEDEPCGYASDLWSLGCVIYTLIEGKSPFRAGSEYHTFQRILKMELKFSPTFPEVAKDLIQKLLVREPSKRLGAPPRGFQELKKHPFFKGIDWENLSTLPAPLKQYTPTPSPETKYIEPQSPSSSFMKKRIMDSPTPTASGAYPARSNDAHKKWRRFLRTTEEILVAGFVTKRRGIFAKRRMLILTDYPRIVYVDAEKMEKKGEIPWTKGLVAEVKNKSTFYIHTETRSYYMQAEDLTAKDWVSKINEPKPNFDPNAPPRSSGSVRSQSHKDSV